MNQDDYKKKYEKLKRFVNDLYPHMSDYCKEKIGGYFHKSAESEDERIRKEIIDFLELPHHQFAGKRDHEKWIAWLEKQDKQKYFDTDTIKKKAHQIAWEISKHYDPNACKQEWCEMAAIDMASWLEKQDKQPYWKPSEEQLQTLHAQLNEGSVTYPEDKRILSTLYEDLMKIMTREEKQAETMKVKSEIVKDYIGEENVWNNACDFRPEHMKRCLCYDKYMGGAYHRNVECNIPDWCPFKNK